MSASFDEKRFRRLALLCLIFQVVDSIVGRTKIQKITYLANLCGWNAVDFRYHNYGPYADELSSEIENLRSIGWLHEQQLSTKDDSFLYSYYFSPQYRKVRDSIISKFVDLNPVTNSKLVTRTKELVEGLVEKDSRDLEIMATLMFLKSQEPNLKEDQLVDMAYELKPQYSRRQFKEGTIVFRMMRHFTAPAPALRSPL